MQSRKMILKRTLVTEAKAKKVSEWTIPKMITMGK